MRRNLDASLEQTKKEEPDTKSLPPMAEAECRDLLLSFLGVAEERILTGAEGFLCGQLLAQFRMSVEARMLAKGEGRYYVVSEGDIERAAALAKARGESDGG